jgi:hypothetical protein
VPIFDRHSLHRYDDELRSMTASAAEETSALAKNLVYDNRVSEAREHSFDKFVDKPCGSGAVLRGLSDYYRARVQTEEHPDYLDPETNGDNLVERDLVLRRRTPARLPGHDALPAIKPNWIMARVIDLNSLTPLFQWALSRREPAWTDCLHRFVSIRDDEGMSHWLDGKLAGAKDSAKERFVAGVLNIMNAHFLETRHASPTYVMPWTAFEQIAFLGAERWLETAGEPRLPHAQWVMLLGYSVAEAGDLVRPTQLDAAWDPYRCPPHRYAPVISGGHPVDFGCVSMFEPPIPQYIHQPILHDVEQWKRLGRRLARSAPMEKKLVARDLSKRRERHYRRMELNYGRSGIPLP